MEFRVLGPLEALLEGQPLSLGGPKQRAVLAVLLARAGLPTSAEFLIDQVYGDDAPAGAKRSVHTFVSNLRRELGGVIQSDRRTYVLNAPPDGVDAVRFESLRREAVELIESDPIRASGLLREALGLWRGHPYADVEARDVLASEIARLDESRVETLELRIEADLAAGRAAELIGELKALTLEHPLRERFRAQHMLALYRAGRQGDALRAYRTIRSVLVEELGVEPSSELRTLELRILEQDPGLTISISSSIERMAVLAAELAADHDTPAQRDAAAAWRDQVFAERAAAHGGEPIDVRRNTVYGRFASVPDALRAAVELPSGSFRMAVDFGSVDVTDETVTGPPITRALRLAAVAHPDQIVVSDDAHRSLVDAGVGGWTLHMLGWFDIRGLGDRVQLFCVSGPGRDDHPPLLIDRLPPPLPELGSASGVAGYELREVLGEGAAGLVYRAYQPSVGREVAVRVIRRDVVSDLRFIRRFEAEMQRIIELSHSSIVPVVDFWRDPTAAFIVSRLSEHPALTATPTMRPDDAVQLIVRIGEALDHGHAAGIVHGRLRPQNLLLDENGGPQILDFGLASLLAGLVSFPADAYTAAETIDGRPSIAGDVYSLGVLAAEFVAGEEVPLDGAVPTTGTPADAVIARATHPDPGSRYPDVSSFLADLVDRTSFRLKPARREVRDPYKGLAPFGEADSSDFFGRDALVANLAEAVSTSRLTVVVGPSGIGKSSAVFAGLIPRLKAESDALVVAAMTPGDRPFRALAEALDRVSVVEPGDAVAGLEASEKSLAESAGQVVPARTELVLVIDQFEELFTLTAEQERDAFLRAVVDNAVDPDSPVRILTAVRADFFDRPLDDPRLGRLVAENTIAVHAPTVNEWRALISTPAERQGVEVDDTLVDAIVDDARTEAGALPLVQHALTQLFGERESDRLTLDAYRRAGGLSGWVGRTAEQLYQALDPSMRGVVRDVFVRLVAVNEETEDTRRRVRQSELERAGLDWATVQTVLGEFVANRLVVGGRDPATRQPAFEVAHEALIREWGRFGAWVDEVREDLLMARRIELATADWSAADRAEEYLYRGIRLERAHQWATTNPGLLAPDQTEFLAASRKVAQRLAAQARRNRRRVLAGLSGALVVALVLAGLAWFQRGVANQRAVENRLQRLATEARLAIEDDPELGVLLALEARDLASGLDSRIQGDVASSLHMTTQASRLLDVLPHPVAFAESSPDGRLLLTDAGDGATEIIVYDQETLVEITRIDVGMLPGVGAFSPDGSEFAVAPGRGADAMRVFDTSDYRETGRVTTPCCVVDLRFSGDGSSVAAFDWDASQIRRWPSDSPRWDYSRRSPGPARWWPDADTIVYATGEQGVLVTEDMETGEVTRLQRFPMSEIMWFDIHPSGESVVLVGDPGIQYWEVGAVEPEWSVSREGLERAEFSLDGRHVALYGFNDEVFVVDADSGETIGLRGHHGAVRDISFDSRGDRLFALQTTGGVKVWDLTAAGRPELGNINTRGAHLALPAWSSSDGQRVAVTEFYGSSAQVSVYETSTGGLVGRSREFTDTLLGPVASHSGRYVAGVTVDETAIVHDLETGEEIFAMPGLVPRAISDDGRFGLFIGDGGRPDGMSLFELNTGVRVAGWSSFRGTIGPAGTPAQGLVASQVNPGLTAIAVRSLETGEELGRVTQTSDLDDVYIPSFSPDGRYLTFGSNLGGGVVVDLETFRSGRPLEKAVVFRALVEGGPTSLVVAGGEFAATAHGGESLRIWRIESGEEWATIPIETSGGVKKATFTGDGRYLYYPASDEVVARMPLDLEELADLAQSSVFRDFTRAECERYEIAADCSGYSQPGLDD